MIEFLNVGFPQSNVFADFRAENVNHVDRPDVLTVQNLVDQRLRNLLSSGQNLLILIVDAPGFIVAFTTHVADQNLICERNLIESLSRTASVRMNLFDPGAIGRVNLLGTSVC